MSEFVEARDGTPVRRSKRVKENGKEQSDSDSANDEQEMEAGLSRIKEPDSPTLRQRGHESNWANGGSGADDDSDNEDDVVPYGRRVQYMIEDHMMTKLAVAALALLGGLAFIGGRPFRNTVLVTIGSTPLYANQTAAAVAVMFALGVLLAVLIRTVDKKNK